MTVRGGDIRFDILADAEKARRGFDQARKHVKGLGDDAERANKKFISFDDRLKKTGDRINTFGSKLTTRVSLPLVALGATSVKAFTEAEETVSALQQALAKNPRLIGENVREYEALATAIQRKTVADDESVLSAATVLSRFALTGKQLKGVLPLVVDYARATKQDLPTAAEAVGKALLGNTRALKTLGINYKLTGDAAKDFENIQRLLNEKVGGYAEREGKTAAGRAVIMKNKFNDLQEQIGRKLLPVFERLVTQGGKLIDWFTSLSPKTQDMIIKIAGLAVVAGPLVKIIGNLASVTGTFVSLGGRLAGAFAGTGAAAATAAPAVSGLAGSVGLLSAAKIAGPIGAAIALGLALRNVGTDADDATTAMGRYRRALNDLPGLTKDIGTQEQHVLRHRLSVVDATKSLSAATSEYNTFVRAGTQESVEGQRAWLAVLDAKTALREEEGKLTAALAAEATAHSKLAQAQQNAHPKAKQLVDDFARLNEHLNKPQRPGGPGDPSQMSKIATAVGQLARNAAEAGVPLKDVLTEVGKITSLPPSIIKQIEVLIEAQVRTRVVSIAQKRSQQGKLEREERRGQRQHSGGRIMRRMHGGGGVDGLGPREVPIVAEEDEFMFSRRSARYWGHGLLDRMNRMHGGGDVTPRRVSGLGPGALRSQPAGHATRSPGSGVTIGNLNVHIHGDPGFDARKHARAIYDEIYRIQRRMAGSGGLGSR